MSNRRLCKLHVPTAAVTAQLQCACQLSGLIMQPSPREHLAWSGLHPHGRVSGMGCSATLPITHPVLRSTCSPTRRFRPPVSPPPLPHLPRTWLPASVPLAPLFALSHLQYHGRRRPETYGEGAASWGCCSCSAVGAGRRERRQRHGQQKWRHPLNARGAALPASGSCGPP